MLFLRKDEAVANRLKMSEVHAILTLRARGWSFRRIGWELGVHRETAARHVRLQEAAGNVLNHVEFLELILQDELAIRADRLTNRRVKAAVFRDPKTLEDFDFSFNPSVKCGFTTRSGCTLKYCRARNPAGHRIRRPRARRVARNRPPNRYRKR